MAKRFTDTEKFKKPWVRALPVDYKLFWIYLLDACNHAGIWDVELEVANIRLGTSVTLEGIAEYFKGRVCFLENGGKLLITAFLEFQYGNLNPDNKVHESILSMLLKAGADVAPYLAPNLGLLGNPQGPLDKDKEKDKDKKTKNSTLIYTSIKEEFDHFLNSEFLEVFTAFLEFRKQIRKPATKHAQRLIMLKLKKVDVPTSIAMLNQSIERGWTGVFGVSSFTRPAGPSERPISKGGTIPDAIFNKMEVK